MRILITPEGKIEILDLANKKYQTTSLIYPTLNRTKSCMNLNKNTIEYESYEDRKVKEQRKKKRKNNSLTKSLIDRNECKINLKEVAKSKKINVGVMKLNDTYRNMFPNCDNDFDEKNEIGNEQIKDLFKSEEELAEIERMKKMQELMYKEKNNKIKNDFLPITNILPKKVVDNLEEKFIKNLKFKYENKRLTEDEFRTTFHEQAQQLIELDDSLKLKIKADRQNLINYLKSKNEISPICLENLKKFDQERIFKANKICQIILNENEAKKKRDELIKQKIISDKDSFRVRTLNRVHSLDNYNLSFTNEILKEYAKKKTIKEANKIYYKNKLKHLYDKHWNNRFLNKQYESLKRKQKVNSFLDESFSPFP